MAAQTDRFDQVPHIRGQNEIFHYAFVQGQWQILQDGKGN